MEVREKKKMHMQDLRQNICMIKEITVSFQY